MFETYFYQPFFNILVGIYWLLGRISPDLEDMGIAVILFSLVVRFLLLPLSLSANRSEAEKHKVVEKVKEIKRQHTHDPVGEKLAIRQLLVSNRGAVVSTTINLLIQLGIVLMLYRIFTTGLEGADFHLLYNFMPSISHINLMFLGKYDLSHTNAFLNLIQSLMIFIVEVLSAINSPFPISKKDVAVTQFFLPVGSFFIFMFMPAGKKLFIITSLAFTAVLLSYKIIRFWLYNLLNKFNVPQEKTEAAEPAPVPE